ncbi:MAG: lipoyl domain-containing protein, partial [Paludisphaera borealis]|uniref:lipoyl domain-containing protein n=1 Tax=Paludisphaera borealis TaxID=1387353 RepID=UPI00284B8FF4
MSAVSISVPGVGESISEGILSRWLVADGSQVKAGDPLFELETDKATNIVPAPASGVLKVGAAEGDVVAIGANIGTIDPSGAPASAAVPAETAAAKPAA